MNARSFMVSVQILAMRNGAIANRGEPRSPVELFGLVQLSNESIRSINSTSCVVLRGACPFCKESLKGDRGEILTLGQAWKVSTKTVRRWKGWVVRKNLVIAHPCCPLWNCSTKSIAWFHWSSVSFAQLHASTAPSMVSLHQIAIALRPRA